MRNKKTLFKHQVMITAITVFAVVISMIGGSYAIFSSTSKADEYNSLTVGELEISYVDTGEGYGDILSLNGSYPISDEEGKQSEPYRFNVVNTGTIAADFRIKIEYDEAIIEEDGCENNLLDFNFVKYQFDNEEPAILGTKESSGYLVYSAKNLLPGSSEIHEIRMWIDENATNEVLGKHFHGKVVIESVQAGIDENLTKAYSIGTPVTLVDGSKWHVLEESGIGNAYVTLLSDYNLNSDGTYNTECGRDINNQKTCSQMDYDTDSSGIYDETDSTSIAYFIKNTYAPLVNGSLSGVSNITIPTAEQIAIADGQILGNSILPLSNTWLLTTHYWTKTNHNSSDKIVWIVNSQTNELSYTSNFVNNSYGVRPVITTLKSNIQTQ